MKKRIESGQSVIIFFSDSMQSDQELIFDLEQDSSLELVLLLTGAVSELSILVTLRGNRAQAQIKGVYILKDACQLQLKTQQVHMASDGTSSCVIKGILYDSSCVRYEGIVRVDHHAHYTTARQVNKNIILSPYARAQSIPSLEVLTKKVQCSHGSAVGVIDREQIIYMQSRGLSAHKAERLLLQGFIEDVVAVVSPEQRIKIQELIR